MDNMRLKLQVLVHAAGSTPPIQNGSARLQNILASLFVDWEEAEARRPSLFRLMLQRCFELLKSEPKVYDLILSPPLINILSPQASELVTEAEQINVKPATKTASDEDE